MLVDTHAHLWDGNDSLNVKNILAKAKYSGITKIIVPGDNKKTSLASIELAKTYPEIIYATAGYYPGQIEDITQVKNEITSLKTMIEENRKWIVAIGEIGLDKNSMDKQLEIDTQVFAEQIKLATELDLPIVVHNRGMDKEITEIIEKLQIKPRAHFHCFSGSKVWLKYLIDKGFYVGLCGNVTYKSNRELREVVKDIPIERLLLETDTPYLPPQGKRGEKNEPCNVTITAQTVAEIKGVPYDELCKRTTENAEKFYGL